MAQPVNILITGSNGFIGKNLVRNLEPIENYKCFISSNLLGNEFDINCLKGIDQIIHLFGVFGNDENLLKEINIKATHKFLKSLNSDIKKIIFLSSGAVYGDLNKGEPSKESDNLLPNTTYGLTKLLAEELVKIYCQKYGITYVILRLPNVYGAGQMKGVLFNFLQQIELHKTITIQGDGTQKRNYLHISDLLNAIKLSIDYKGPSEVFNISNKTLLSVNDLVEIFKNNYSFDITHVEQENKLNNLNLDYSKAKEKLKYIPKINEVRLGT